MSGISSLTSSFVFVFVPKNEFASIGVYTFITLNFFPRGRYIWLRRFQILFERSMYKN